MDQIYLDYNATTRIDPLVAEAMLPYIHQHFGNPSSDHSFGVAAKAAVDVAREQVAAMLGCSPTETVFTSGGTEANNAAIKGVVGAYRDKGNHIITSAVEHPAVIEVCRYLESRDCRITYLPVDQTGLVDPAQVADAISDETVLVTVMHANNEVGTIEPIRELSEIAHQRGVLVHADCAQSVGKIPVNVDDIGVDLLSIAGHKLYAPKGIGALYIRDGVRLEKLIHGANHEGDRRAGTENVIQAVGLGEACRLIGQHLTEYQDHLREMRDRLETGIVERFPEHRINGHLEKRLPNTSSISFKDLEANVILSELTGVAASAGAACHSDRVEVSSVLEAMEVPLAYAMGTIRFSVGRYTTAAEVDLATNEIVRVLTQLTKQREPARMAQSTDSV
jgi:cysteine desulfurase NifS